METFAEVMAEQDHAAEQVKVACNCLRGLWSQRVEGGSWFPPNDMLTSAVENYKYSVCVRSLENLAAWYCRVHGQVTDAKLRASFTSSLMYYTAKKSNPTRNTAARV